MSKILSFRWRACPRRTDKVWCFTLKEEAVVTQAYNVRSAPNFTHLIICLAWTHLYRNIWLRTKRHLLAAGSVAVLNDCHKSPVLTRLHACCPLFALILRPTGGGEPGCEGPFIIIIIILQSKSHFWGPKRAQKLMKLCTRVRSGENLRLLWVSELGVAKWLDSAI